MLIDEKLITTDIFKYGYIFTDKKRKYNIPKFILDNWSNFQVDNFDIYIHPNEKINIFSIDSNKVVIIGDVFVAHSDLDIVDIFEKFIFNKDWKLIDLLSGRFNIYITGSENYVFIDPIGSKTLYYSDNNFGVFCNHSLLLAIILNKKIDESVLKYKKSSEYNLKGTKFLPGDITMFPNIYGLSPNNYIDINTNLVKRHYDFSLVKKVELNELRLKVFEYYKNFSKFIKKNKYRPIVGLTAGVDTRLIISAFLYFDVDFDLITWNRGVSNEEMDLINEISKYLNKKHYFIDTKSLDDNKKYENLKYLSNYNTGLSRGNCSLTVKFKNIFFDNKKYLFVRGLGGEIVRGMFNKRKSNKNSNNLDYAVYVYNTNALNKIERSNDYDMLTNKYISEYFNRTNVLEVNNVDIGDVLYWEQRMGRWASELHNENDLAVKNFTGLNSRVIYNIAFGLDDDVRFTRDLLIDLASIFDEKLAKFKYI